MARATVWLCSFLMVVPLAAAIAPPLGAQAVPTGRIVGRVVDAAQGAPIAGVEVTLVGGPQRVVTALDGRYTIE